MADINSKDLISSIGWLDSFSGDEFAFDSADWSGAEDDGVVYLEGCYNPSDGPRQYLSASFKLVEIETSPLDDWNDEDEDDEVSA